MKTQEEIEQLAKKQKGCSKEYCDSIDEQYGYTKRIKILMYYM